MSRLALLPLLIGCLAFAACSSQENSKKTLSATCVSGDERCGRSCDDEGGCGGALFCDDENRCAQECDTRNPCEQGSACKSGQCVKAVADGGVVKPNHFDASFTPNDDDGGSSDICADQELDTRRVKPTVMLIIDQSSSMNDDFGGAGSRWNVLRDFLLADNGLIASFQDQVSFGLAMYSADSDRDEPLPVTPIGECPRVSGVAPAMNNFQSIETAYRAAEPIEDTPTGDAIDKVLADLNLENDPDAEHDPIVFVLATDGEPDTCEQLDPQQGQQEAIAAVSRAFDQHIQTFVIAVGNEISATHQQDIANAGLGRGAGDAPAEYWQAGDDTTLRAALTEIIGSQVSCDISLDGQVAQADACLGSVILNGEALPCEGDNGWTWVDDKHIRLQGTACTNLKELPAAMLHVTFPCGVPIVD